MAALFRMERGISYAKAEQVGRVAVESLLTVTVGVLLGRLAWVALAPANATPAGPEFVSAAMTAPDAENAQTRTGLLSEMNPFDDGSVAPSSSDIADSETTLDLTLAGVRSVAGNITASSAVIAFPDGHQKRFVPGDEVMPGILLVNVTSDSVHLSRGGALETLSFYPADKLLFAPDTTMPESGETLMLASTAAPAPTDITPAALAADTTLTPEFRSGEVSGYRVAPRGSGVFEAAGLEADDLILRINGEAIEGLRPDQISQSVSSASDIALDVVRKGAIVRLRVAPEASPSR